MPEDNSITERVLSIVRDTWENDAVSVDDEFDDTTREEIFNFINNPENLCTAGFILRRHIQINFPELLKKAAENCNIKDYADLTKSGNVAWKNNLVRELAQILKQTKFDAINIDARQWTKFLNDAAICNRETAIKIIFALKFDEAAAAKFLIANGKDLFSTRNPYDYFCRFCLRCGFSYDTATFLLQRFENEVAGLENTARNLTPNATTLLENETVRISRNDKLSAAEKQDAILKYALKYKDEFVKKNNGDYPSGFSRQNTQKLRIFLKYLTELYPNFLQYKEIGKFDAGLFSVKVEKNKDGLPAKPIHLTTAMNDDQEIDLYELEDLLENLPNYIPQQQARRIFEGIPFNKNILFPLKNLSKTLRSNLRAENYPDNAKDVDRSTILFLTYFFICGCYNLSKAESDKFVRKLESEIRNNIDDAVGNNLRYALKSVINNIEDEDADKLQIYINSLDTLLESFNCSKFYAPFLADRCVLLCLLKVRPKKVGDDFSEYLMAQLIEMSYEFSKKILETDQEVSNE